MEQKRGHPLDNYRETSMHLISCVCVAYYEFPVISNEEAHTHTDQPPLMHIIRTTHLKFFWSRADPSVAHSRALRSSVAPYQGTGTADQAKLAKLGSAQLNLMSLH